MVSAERPTEELLNIVFRLQYWTTSRQVSIRVVFRHAASKSTSRSDLQCCFPTYQEQPKPEEYGRDST